MFLSVRSFASMKAESVEETASFTGNEAAYINLDDEVSYLPIRGKPIQSVINPEPKMEPKGKKNPTKLGEKLRETLKPVVGLSFVSETIPRSNPEAEPFYECRLCRSKGRAKKMFKHLLRKSHRVKFLQRMHPGDPKYLTLNHKERMLEVNHWRENDHLDRIQTIYNDELYPWPVGNEISSPIWVSAESKKRKRDILELKEDGIKDVGDCRQLDHYYQMASMILDKMSEFHIRNCSARGADELQTWYSVIRTSLQTMRNISASDIGEISMSLSPLSQSSYSHGGFKPERSPSISRCNNADETSTTEKKRIRFIDL